MDQAWSAAHADFLSSLAPDEVNALKAKARRLSFSKGDQIFVAGDKSEAVYILISGCIKLFQLSPSGKEIILWFSFPGELFGVAETVRGVDREIFAEANVDSEILKLAEADFVEFLSSHPRSALRAIDILSARVRTLGSSIVDIAADDVETRLIRLLLRFAAGTLPMPCQLPLAPNEQCLNVRLTHNDLANLIGASRQTVTTMLTGLRRKDLLRLVDGHIHLLDPGRLKQLL